MEPKKPLMQMLLEAGYLRDQMFHHYSDLYVFATPLVDRVINEWRKDNGFYVDLFKSFLINSFIDNITGRRMYDIAFQYLDNI